MQRKQGEVSEWFKEPVLKTGDAERHRGFESHLLRFSLQNFTAQIAVIFFAQNFFFKSFINNFKVATYNGTKEKNKVKKEIEKNDKCNGKQ